MNVFELNDQELVRAYIAGDESALSELLNRHQRKVFTSIMMFVRDQALAEDIFQDTFVKVIESLKLGKYSEEGKFLPWLMRISHNLCIDYYRKVKRSPKKASSDDYDIFNLLKFSDSNGEDIMIKDQTKDRVRKLIESLPEEQKEVVILRHYANLSFKEIADITKVSINTALGRMRYALINMRKAVEEYQIAL